SALPFGDCNRIEYPNPRTRACCPARPGQRSRTVRGLFCFALHSYHPSKGAGINKMKCLPVKPLGFLLFTGAIFFSTAGSLRAQAVYGNIVGTVEDSSGAAIPSAKVTITDTNRDVTVSTTS